MILNFCLNDFPNDSHFKIENFEKHMRENKAAAHGGIKQKTAMMEHW